MAEERLRNEKNVYSKSNYEKTIDTSFSELGTTTVAEDILDTPSTSEFFVQYNTLFYDIPALGETNSHEYLAKTSGEYINFQQNQEEIDALQAEIAQLRTDLLNAQMEVIKTEISSSGSPEASDSLNRIQREIEIASQNTTETAENLSQQQNTSFSPTGGSSAGSTAGGGGSVSGGGGGGGY